MRIRKRSVLLDLVELDSGQAHVVKFDKFCACSSPLPICHEIAPTAFSHSFGSVLFAPTTRTNRVSLISCRQQLEDAPSSNRFQSRPRDRQRFESLNHALFSCQECSWSSNHLVQQPLRPFFFPRNTDGRLSVGAIIDWILLAATTRRKMFVITTRVLV